MPAQDHFRKNLRVAMESRSMTQRVLAEKAGTHHPYVNRVLSGETSPSLDQCERLAKAAGFRLMDLLENPESFADAVLTAGRR